MSQKKTFVYKLLEIPFLYSTFQSVVGATKCRRFIVSNFLSEIRSDVKILDVGCGPGEILDFLPNDIDYTGIDLQTEYIEKAKKRYGHRARFYCLDINDINNLELDQYDIILGFGFLHHLSDNEVERLIDNISRYLKDNGVFLSLENALTEDQSFISRYIVSRDRGDHVRTPAQYRRLLGSKFSHITTNVYHNLLRIPYTHVVNSCQI